MGNDDTAAATAYHGATKHSLASVQRSRHVLDFATLAHLLYFTAGVLRRRSYPGGDAFFRAQACTGNLHHIDLYLACGDLPDLAAGVYHFGAHDFALRRLRDG